MYGHGKHYNIANDTGAPTERKLKKFTKQLIIKHQSEELIPAIAQLRKLERTGDMSIILVVHITYFIKYTINYQDISSHLSINYLYNRRRFASLGRQ